MELKPKEAWQKVARKPIAIFERLFRDGDKTKKGNEWRNLAPSLFRQRLMIEATTEKIAEQKQIEDYLVTLADVACMEIVSGPFAYSAHEMGYGGWIHWKSSGSHFYSYPTNPPLITVDIYTCKPFEVEKVARFTREYFKTIDIVWKEP